MKTIGYIIGLQIVLFGLISCTHSMDEIEVQSSESSNYIVNYGIESSSGTTRAYTDDLPANERIASLIYLLYDANGDLLKARNIPDIGLETQWPLRRDDAEGGGNMTWGQRLALRDTLLCDQSYTAVFVANASPDLFDGEEILIYRSDDAALGLDQVYLKLPSTRFEDNNMFYLCVQEIPAVTNLPPESSLIDRDHPLDCPIQLKRIVSRTDISRFDYIGQEDPQTAYQTYIRQRVTDDLYSTIEQQYISQDVSDFLELLVSEVSSKTIDNVELSFAFLSFQDDVMAHAPDIATALRQTCLDYLTDRCLLATGLEYQLKDWNGATARLKFGNGMLQADRFYLHTQVAGSEQGEGLIIDYPIDEYDTLSIIGFGNSESSTSINGIQSFSIVPEGESAPIEIRLNDPVQILKGMNRKQTLICNPVATLELGSEITTQNHSATFDLQQIMQDVSSWTQFAPFVEEVLSEQSHGSLTQTTLSLALPDLSASGSVLWNASLESGQ